MRPRTLPLRVPSGHQPLGCLPLQSMPGHRHSIVDSVDCETVTVQEAERRVKQTETALIKRLGRELVHELRSCLDWQFWCWGQDANWQPVNGLVRSGFQRCPPPTETPGSSCYRLQISTPTSPDCKVALWSYGLYYGDASGGIFLWRFYLGPCLVHGRSFPPLIWSRETMFPIIAPQTEHEFHQCLGYFEQACEWIASYEEAILRNSAAYYRQQCWNSWKNKTQMMMASYWPDRWRELLEKLSQARRINEPCQPLA